MLCSCDITAIYRVAQSAFLPFPLPSPLFLPSPLPPSPWLPGLRSQFTVFVLCFVLFVVDAWQMINIISSRRQYQPHYYPIGRLVKSLLTTLTSTKSTLPTTLAWWSRPSENGEEVGHGWVACLVCPSPQNASRPSVQYGARSPLEWVAHTST